MKRWIEYIIIVMCMVNSQLSAQSQNEGLQKFLDDPDLKTATFGFRIVDADTEQEVVSYNAALTITPASVFKLLTSSVALDLYKPDYRFITRVAYTGTIDQGVLNGNLYIVGSGDPTLGSRYSVHPKNEFLNQCIQSLKKAGIKKITGEIIADASIFGTEGVSNRWMWEDMGNYYGAGAYGINYSDNLYEITFESGEPGTTPQIVKTVPDMSDIRFVNYLKATQVTYDSAYIRGAPYVHERELAGAIPCHQQAFTIKGDIPDPALYLAKTVARGLDSAGIECAQSATTQRIRKIAGIQPEVAPRKELMAFYSDSLKEIVKTVNHISNNHYTEVLLRLIALSKYKEATIQRGVEVLRTHLTEKGVDLNGLFMYDGSGLSPLNRVSVNTLTSLLIKMYKNSDTLPEFESSLPLAGKDATLRSFLKGTPLEGCLRLKSGSITNVQCYAGYTTVADKKYAVAVMVNNYTCSRSEINKKLEKLLLSYKPLLAPHYNKKSVTKK